MRLYPDPQATALRAALAAYHQVRLEQVFVGNGSDEVLAHAFAGLLKHDAPLLEDEAYFQEARTRVIEGRERLSHGLFRLGFEVLPSSANFVFARTWPMTARR